MAQALYTAGVRKGDFVRISTDLGMFMGSWGALWGAEEIGAPCFTPGAGNQERHVRRMHEVHGGPFLPEPERMRHHHDRTHAHLQAVTPCASTSSSWRRRR